MAWWVVPVALGVVSGYVFAAPEWTSPSVPYWTAGGAAVGLAIAVVLAHTRIHPWWGVPTVWMAFMVGMVPPLSDDDALWAVAAIFLGGFAAAYLAVVNVMVLGVRRLRSERHRRRGGSSL